MQIAFIGTQNTGKTTCLHDFLKRYPHFTTPKVTYRDIVKKNNLGINRNGTVQNQCVIFDYLAEQYNEVIASGIDVVFDRSPIDAYVYTQYISSITDYRLLSYMLDTAISVTRMVDIIFHFPLIGNEHIEMHEDELRDVDFQYRKDIAAIFSDVLNVYKKSLPPILTITGTREERMDYISKLLL